MSTVASHAKLIVPAGAALTVTVLTLALAVLFHGSFDFFLFLQQNREVTSHLSTGVLSFGAFATFYIAVRLAMRALRMPS